MKDGPFRALDAATLGALSIAALAGVDTRPFTGTLADNANTLKKTGALAPEQRPSRPQETVIYQRGRAQTGAPRGIQTSKNA